MGMAEAEGGGKGEWRSERHWYQWCDTGKCISRERGGEGEAVSIAWTSMGAVEGDIHGREEVEGRSKHQCCLCRQPWEWWKRREGGGDVSGVGDDARVRVRVVEVDVDDEEGEWREEEREER